MIRKILGVAILVILFVIWYACIAIGSGNWILPAIVFGIAGIVSALIMLAIHLIWGEKKC